MKRLITSFILFFIINSNLIGGENLWAPQSAVFSNVEKIVRGNGKFQEIEDYQTTAVEALTDLRKNGLKTKCSLYVEALCKSEDNLIRLKKENLIINTEVSKYGTAALLMGAFGFLGKIIQSSFDKEYVLDFHLGFNSISMYKPSFLPMFLVCAAGASVGGFFWKKNYDRLNALNKNTTINFDATSQNKPQSKRLYEHFLDIKNSQQK